MPLLLSIADSEQDRERVVRFISGGHIDGALLVSTHAGNPVIGRLASLGIPTVACGLPIGHERELAYVAVNEAEGARAGDRAPGRARGRRRIATVTGPLDLPGGRDRLGGYREALDRPACVRPEADRARRLHQDFGPGGDGEAARDDARTSTPCSSPPT